MIRKYIALSDDPRPLAVGDYILKHDVLIEDPNTGQLEMLLVMTDTRLTGAERTKARYIVPGEHIEFDPKVSFHFFVGAQRRLRAVLDLPEEMPVRRVNLPMDTSSG